MDDRNRLEETLRSIEAQATAFDAGDLGAAVGIAEGLRAIFHASPLNPSLLSRLNATYTRIASSVPKPPYPDDRFLPLVQVQVDLTKVEGKVVQASTDLASIMGSPRFAPVLGAHRDYRQVQAPDWWKSEPVFILNHSRVTRKDLTLWAVSSGRDLPAGETLPQLYEQLRGGKFVYVKLTMTGGGSVEAPVEDAQPAALRQVAHEIFKSGELRKLAGQVTR
jgi:hypothetical protein